MRKQLVTILLLALQPLPTLAMAAAQVVTTHLALHVPQLHQQDMLLLTLGVVAVPAAIILQELLVWHLQTARAMLSFPAAAVVLVVTIHQARAVRLISKIKMYFTLIMS